MKYYINDQEVSKETFEYYMSLKQKENKEKHLLGTLKNNEKENTIYKAEKTVTIIGGIVFEKCLKDNTKKINITDFSHLVEKKLGLNPILVIDYIDRYLSNKYPHKIIGRRMKAIDLEHLRSKFLSLVNINSLNPLDYECFIRKTEELMINGSGNFHAVSENNGVVKRSEYIKTVIIVR